MRTDRRVLSGVLAALLGAGLAPPALSTALAQPASDSGLAQVEVLASLGPPLWRVTQGASELVILGTLSPTPDGARWNARPLAGAMHGARALLLSPGSAPGFAWAEHFPEWQRRLLGQPFGRSLFKELTPDVGARVRRTAESVRQPVGEYGSYRPAPAGMRLLEDAWRAHRLNGSKVDEEVVALAGSARVRVVRVDEGGALPLINAMPSMTPAQQTACLGEALDQVDRLAPDADVDFQAWAKGDLVTLMNGYRPPRLCLDSIPGGAERVVRARAIWRRALEEALRAPGRTVAVMDVSELWEPSDLLASLQASGATVTRPRGDPSPEAASLRVAASQLAAPAGVPNLVEAEPTVFQLGSPQGMRAASPAETSTPSPYALPQDVVCAAESPIGSRVSRTICRRATASALREAERKRQVDESLRDLRQTFGSR